MRLSCSILVAACLVAGVPSTAAAAATWSPWFSEESTPPWQFCGPTNEAVSGVRCSGTRCDNVGIRCETAPYGITMASYSWSNWYSEEDNGIGTTSSAGWYAYDGANSHVCYWSGDAGIVTGFACNGRYCDNISLECAQPRTNVAGTSVPAELTDCEWSGWYSEEDPWFAYGVGSNRWITGVECDGSHCDRKSYYVCSLLPAENSCWDHCGGQSRGGSCWCDAACTSYGDCCADYDAAC